MGAFNIDNQETLRAICQAAQKTNAPVIVEVSANEAASLGGYENIRDLVDNYSQNYGVEMYINLDHAPTVEGCKQAIDAGFEFIHIDISQANHDATLEEIIEKTREVVEYAKFTAHWSRPRSAISLVILTCIKKKSTTKKSKNGIPSPRKPRVLSMLRVLILWRCRLGTCISCIRCRRFST